MSTLLCYLFTICYSGVFTPTVLFLMSFLLMIVLSCRPFLSVWFVIFIFTNKALDLSSSLSLSLSLPHSPSISPCLPLSLPASLYLSLPLSLFLSLSLSIVDIINTTTSNVWRGASMTVSADSCVDSCFCWDTPTSPGCFLPRCTHFHVFLFSNAVFSLSFSILL